MAKRKRSSPETGAVEMDTPGGRHLVPAVPGRLHGGDRSGLGEKGWAEETPEAVAHPDDTNVPPDYYRPQPLAPKDRGA